MKYIQGSTETHEISQNDCYWNMLCRLDNNIQKLEADDIQNVRAVYIFFGWDDKPLRIGKAVKARNRILSYYTNQLNYAIFDQFQDQISFVSVIYCKNEADATNLELDLIKKHKPAYNFNSKKDN